MARRMWGLSSLVLVLTAGGCAMCQNPWDCCGPVLGPGGPSCDWNARRGSIFQPMDGAYSNAPSGPTPAELPFGEGPVPTRSSQPEDAEPEPARPDAPSGESPVSYRAIAGDQAASDDDRPRGTLKLRR